MTENTGLTVSKEHPYLGASLDGFVQCSKCGTGGLEIKCPYKWRGKHPSRITDPMFCSSLVNGKMTLKHQHNYYFQVMGQLGVCELDWADFYIWTKEGSCVERIYFNSDVWSTIMLPKLTSFYTNCFVPELYACRVKRGQPLQ